MKFRVTLPRALSQEVAIGYATKDGTAIAPYDYLPAAGSVSIPAGETEAWIDVLVVGDTAPAADEVFFVQLTNVGVYLDSTARRTAVGTIVNDDNRPFHQTGQFVFTTTEDFHEGRLLNLTATAVPDQLRLDPADLGIFPFVNVPASSRGTVIRIDVRTGEVVGEYITAPGWIAPETSDERPTRRIRTRTSTRWDAIPRGPRSICWGTCGWPTGPSRPKSTGSRWVR
jgi:hypothetical protein